MITPHLAMERYHNADVVLVRDESHAGVRYRVVKNRQGRTGGLLSPGEVAELRASGEERVVIAEAGTWTS